MFFKNAMNSVSPVNWLSELAGRGVVSGVLDSSAKGSGAFFLGIGGPVGERERGISSLRLGGRGLAKSGDREFFSLKLSFCL